MSVSLLLWLTFCITVSIAIRPLDWYCDWQWRRSHTHLSSLWGFLSPTLNPAFGCCWSRHHTLPHQAPPPPWLCFQPLGWFRDHSHDEGEAMLCWVCVHVCVYFFLYGPLIILNCVLCRGNIEQEQKLAHETTVLVESYTVSCVYPILMHFALTRDH